MAYNELQAFIVRPFEDFSLRDFILPPFFRFVRVGYVDLRTRFLAERNWQFCQYHQGNCVLGSGLSFVYSGRQKIVDY